MDLLITLIGNAAVDPIFREKFLANPLGTADQYHFVLTKGDVELLKRVFSDLTNDMKKTLDKSFEDLQNALYARLLLPDAGCKRPPCLWSVFPPADLRGEYEIREREMNIRDKQERKQVA